MTIPEAAPGRRCPACGDQMDLDARFCHNCGVAAPFPAAPPARAADLPEQLPGERTVPRVAGQSPEAEPRSDGYDAASILIAGGPASQQPPAPPRPPVDQGWTGRPAPPQSFESSGPLMPPPAAVPTHQPTGWPVPPPSPFPGGPPLPIGGPYAGPPILRPTPRPHHGERPGQWAVGDLIGGRFQVHRKIVSGMGVVYLCYDEDAAEPIAIKTYLDGLASGPGGDTEFAQLFESEALLWIRLGRHPHIVQAKYVLRLGGKPHIFLEYVPGPTGGESTVRRLLRAGRADVRTALLLAIQTCAAMEHATAIFPGFVHRDLKPENLLLSPDHVLKITDFGLTKVFADFSGNVGVVAGTPPYMSPEQCLGLPTLDTRSDVYALGVILYELLTGRRPFAANDVAEHLRAHLIEPPRPPREIAADVPEAVDTLVLRCLEKSPERRYPSFAALRTDLEQGYEAVVGRVPILPNADEAGQENAAALATIEMARAISLVTLGRYEEAMTVFDLAVQHDPSLGRAWFYRGLALNGLGRFQESLECLDRVVRLDPRDANAWVEKGRALTRAGRREEALECFDHAIAINPWHTAALYEKGACLLFLGRYALAAACIGEVASLQPGPAVEAARQACQAGLSRLSNPVAPSVSLEGDWAGDGLSDVRLSEEPPYIDASDPDDDVDNRT